VTGPREPKLMADRFATRLAAEVARWAREGLVSAQQAEAILARYPARSSWLSRPLTLCCLIGGALVAAGIALVVAHNWEVIHRGVKLGTLTVLMVGAHAGGLALRERGAPRLAEALFLVGGALLLVGIGLIGQVYNLVGRPADAVLLWWLLVLPLGYVLPTPTLGALGWLGAGGWYGLAILDPVTLLGRHIGPPGSATVAFCGLGLLYLGLGGLHDDARFRWWRQLLEQVGILSLSGGLLVLGFRDDAAWRAWQRPLPEGPSVVALATLGVAVLVILLWLARLPEESRSARLVFVAVAMAVAAYLVAYAAAAVRWPGARLVTTLRVTDWLLLLAVALVLIVYGARWNRSAWINWGVVVVGVHAVARYLDLFGTLLQTSLLFFSAGALVLVLGWWLDRVRRQMTGRAAGRAEA
jgi:uncharacterized membrane protein